jgi:hypothetical protein
VPQGTSRIVVSCAPVLLHACSREFIVLGMPFIISGTANQVDDVEDLAVGACLIVLSMSMRLADGHVSLAWPRRP